MDAVAGAAATKCTMPKPDLQWESDTQLKVEVTSDGLGNGVAFWFEVCKTASDDHGVHAVLSKTHALESCGHPCCCLTVMLHGGRYSLSMVCML